MMRSFVRSAVLVLGVASVALAFAVLPASAGPGTTICTGALTGGVINNNLSVPPSATCTLDGVRVAGNATVAGHLNAYGYTFDANVTVNGGTIVLANGGRIGGNLTITGSPGSNILGTPNPGSFHTIWGNFTYTGNVGTGDGLGVDYARVGGNVTASFNTNVWNINLLHTTAAGNVTVGFNTVGGRIWLNDVDNLGNVAVNFNTVIYDWYYPSLGQGPAMRLDDVDAGGNLWCEGNVPAPGTVSDSNSAGGFKTGQCAGI